jgi:hypothetical protein
MTWKIQSEGIRLEVVHADAAGIDIGNETHYVAVPPTWDSQPVRRFGCTTAELKEMAVWLKQCAIRTVAMQSTGVYWIAVYGRTSGCSPCSCGSPVCGRTKSTSLCVVERCATALCHRN